MMKLRFKGDSNFRWKDSRQRNFSNCLSFIFIECVFAVALCSVVTSTSHLNQSERIPFSDQCSADQLEKNSQTLLVEFSSQVVKNG